MIRPPNIELDFVFNRIKDPLEQSLRPLPFEDELVLERVLFVSLHDVMVDELALEIDDQLWADSGKDRP